ncbi:MAG: sulfide/dihydroorotate dehydrogenase-like FAD/NAD-binding protein [Candidatus Bathyarchaeota archaeon]|nr:sulfide/dihydroorotate dehydrogenase-like FAD/NAD-binding protein [Candidatus Bathyarchaeum tardum]WNZ30070.1 MAG: sulfide/dihydroorotate dehydrogenase-like FAD/NAD-binding protein [Candidatus Bathyarchaeota archaeon]
MYKIITKEEVAPNIHLIEIAAPDVALKSHPGQFVIIRLDDKGERVPLTIAGVDLQKGTVSTAFHAVGKTTKKLAKLKAGDSLLDFSGPLGNPAEVENFGKVLLVGGGVWCAPLHYVAVALKKNNNKLVVVAAGRTKNDMVYENQLKAVADEFHVATDDGSKGNEGLDFINDILKAQKFDHAVIMGPVSTLKKIVEMTKPYNLKTMVTLASLMVDGTGMCGACRVTVGGETKFACMDGPEFNGLDVDFDELISRQRVYLPEERMASMIYDKLGGSVKRG